MKKRYILLFVIIVFVGFLAGYRFGYKVSPRDFIGEDTKIIYANEGIADKDFKEVMPLINAAGKEADYKKFEETKKYISKIYAFSDSDFYNKDIKSAVVVDTGYWYFFILKDSVKYFDKDGEFYRLKSKYMEKYGLKRDIYMCFHRGLIIFSENKSVLKKIINKKGTYNAKIENIIDETRDNLLGTLIYNNVKTKDLGIEAVSLTGTIDKDVVKLQGKIIGDKDVFAAFNDQPEERKLLKYTGKNTIYLSMKDFSKLEKLVFNSYTLGNNKDLILAMWQGFIGTKPSDLLKEIDGEIIADTNNATMMIPLKNAEKVRKALSMFKTEDGYRISNRARLFFKDESTLVYGKDSFVENPHPAVLVRGQFLYGSLDIYSNFGIEELQGTDLNIAGIGNEVTFEAEINSKNIERLLRRIK
ncbi:hypothetical protein M2102_003221 [Fusobacterium sp. PH5-7]|uniref:hypothetical protein n=1 Tax=Fusobacterium sp. PH5-7 TaxID=2940528 RepID=UPI002473B3C4|nr:hypothetical protein [Fusobacterium sp. PH5-7]MDH6459567.1 hypothetical protein [Fusobacterium sp. PH5-7]